VLTIEDEPELSAYAVVEGEEQKDWW